MKSCGDRKFHDDPPQRRLDRFQDRRFLQVGHEPPARILRRGDAMHVHDRGFLAGGQRDRERRLDDVCSPAAN